MVYVLDLEREKSFTKSSNKMEIGMHLECTVQIDPVNKVHSLLFMFGQWTIQNLMSSPHEGLGVDDFEFNDHLLCKR